MIWNNKNSNLQIKKGSLAHLRPIVQTHLGHREFVHRERFVLRRAKRGAFLMKDERNKRSEPNEMGGGLAKFSSVVDVTV